MKIIKLFLVFVTLISYSFAVNAEVNADVWPYIKERMFEDRPIEEVNFLKIDGPKRASSGAQVPINVKLTPKAGVEIKKLLSLLIVTLFNLLQPTISQEIPRS